MTDTDSPIRTVNAYGVGTAGAVPDVITLALGVETRGAGAGEALASNASLATGLIQTLRDSGIRSGDIRTSQVSIHPVYGQDGQIDGYQVSNTVNATMHDVSAAGPLIDTITGRVGDGVRIHGLSFGLSDDTEPMTAARAGAVRQAMTHARELAGAAGVSLGALLNVREIGGYPRPVVARAGMALSAGTPIEPGSHEVSVTVEVEYEISGQH